MPRRLVEPQEALTRTLLGAQVHVRDHDPPLVRGWRCTARFDRPRLRQDRAPLEECIDRRHTDDGGT